MIRNLYIFTITSWVQTTQGTISHKSLAYKLVDDGRHPGTAQAAGHVPMIYTFKIFIIVDLHVWSSGVFEGGISLKWIEKNRLVFNI